MQTGEDLPRRSWSRPRASSWASATFTPDQFKGRFATKPAADHLLLTAPDAMANEGLATLSDNVTDAYRAVGPALAARPGADVLIVAATPGSISLYAAALALTLGAGTVRYLDVDADRVETAVALGADATHHEGPWPRRLERAEITVDATGQPDGLATVIRSTEPYGLCTSVAVYFDPNGEVIACLHCSANRVVAAYRVVLVRVIAAYSATSTATWWPGPAKVLGLRV